MEGVLGGLANARRGVLEQRANQFTRLIGRRLDTGYAAGDGEWHQRSWISERPVQSSDGQGVAARLTIGRATGQRLGGVGTDIGVRVADESNESCGVLRSAEADDEPGGVTPVLPGPGQQCSKADCDGLLVERADSCCEDHGGAGEGSAKRPSERIIGRSGDSAEARGEIAQEA
jgi:hypothetical protein